MRRILLVEDDAANRGALARLLRQKHKDFSVVETGTLAEAKFALENTPPECVVLDLNLPDSPTEETIAAIAHFTPRSAVIAYTGVEDPALFSRVMEAGAMGIITKGSPSETIIEKILLALIKHEPGDAVDLGRLTWENRREHHHTSAPTQVWWTTTKILAATATVVITQAAILVGFIYSQGQKEALREKAISDATAALAVISPEVAHLKEQAAHDAKMLELMDSRITRQWDAVQALRTEMSQGFQRVQDQNSQILKLMIEQRPGKAVNQHPRLSTAERLTLASLHHPQLRYARLGRQVVQRRQGLD